MREPYCYQMSSKDYTSSSPLCLAIGTPNRQAQNWCIPTQFLLLIQLNKTGRNMCWNWRRTYFG